MTAVLPIRNVSAVWEGGVLIPKDLLRTEAALVSMAFLGLLEENNV